MLFDGFDVVNFAKTTLSEFAKDFVVMDLIWHHVMRKMVEICNYKLTTITL